MLNSRRRKKMRITISFEADNAAFVDDFDGEVKKIMKQAEDFIVQDSDNENLFDTNGNKVGFVYRSSVLKPR